MSNDWVDDESLSREDTLARFEVLSPQPTLSPFNAVTISNSTLPSTVWQGRENGFAVDPSRSSVQKNEWLTPA